MRRPPSAPKAPLRQQQAVFRCNGALRRRGKGGHQRKPVADFGQWPPQCGEAHQKQHRVRARTERGFVGRMDFERQTPGAIRFIEQAVCPRAGVGKRGGGQAGAFAAGAFRQRGGDARLLGCLPDKGAGLHHAAALAGKRRQNMRAGGDEHALALFGTAGGQPPEQRGFAAAANQGGHFFGR